MLIWARHVPCTVNEILRASCHLMLRYDPSTCTCCTMHASQAIHTSTRGQRGWLWQLYRVFYNAAAAPAGDAAPHAPDTGSAIDCAAARAAGGDVPAASGGAVAPSAARCTTTGLPSPLSRSASFRRNTHSSYAAGWHQCEPAACLSETVRHHDDVSLTAHMDTYRMPTRAIAMLAVRTALQRSNHYQAARTHTPPACGSPRAARSR